jgi:hypothetical protein
VFSFRDGGRTHQVGMVLRIWDGQPAAAIWPLPEICVHVTLCFPEIWPQLSAMVS